VLGDFSLSNEIRKIKETDSFLGEGKYLAPETMKNEDPSMIDLKKVDLYAFGRTLVEIMLSKLF
jgi:serine/threonine protein kinase